MFNHKGIVFFMLFVGITVITAFKISAISQDFVALADPRPSPIFLIKVENDGKLILTVGENKVPMSLPDGTYQNGKGSWIFFKGGRPLILLVSRNTPLEVKSVKVYNKRVMFFTHQKKPTTLLDGMYSLRNPKNGGVQVKNGMFVGVIAPVK